MLASRLLRSRWLGTVAVTAAILTAGGVLGTSAYAGEDEHRALPAHVFSPYFQAYTDASPAQQSAASGARYLTMAFLQTAQTGSCDILWNGDPTKPVAWSTFGPDIAKIRAHGGDVIPSFGGFTADDTATEIADSCPDVDKIAAAFEKVITTYNVTRLDLDVEDNSLTNTAGIDRRNKAIRKVQEWAARHRRAIQFVYTIPTGPTGLEQTGIDVLANAVRNGARIDIVNIMTFDYYDDQAHEMARDTKTAAAGLVSTLHTLYPHRPTARLWRMVGITEMIGIDDYGSGGETGPKEIFTLADAKDITRWAADHNIAELSFWALGRDNGGCPGTPGSDDCSGVAQSAWQFTHIMTPFTHGHDGRDGDDGRED
ncbi:MAG: chitinase [Actinobacteria bacterium]|nr:MAG: chitinase [Actinomycetota bacterium]